MTTLVRGPIKLVTDRPDTVRKVSIRAPRLRLHGAGIVTDHSDEIPVVGGQVEFEALPGPAVLTLVTAGGEPLRSVDIVVPDEDTATLAECLGQVYTYDPPVVGRAQQFAREAGEHAARAQTQAGIATEQAGVATGHAEQTGEDRRQTGDDRAQTADDRRQTGEDRAQTGKDAEAAEQWAEQSKDAAAQAITAAATVNQYAGEGFPEGKVTAPVGAVYIDTAATNGAIRWIKASGTGNTGWRVQHGDTGWRDIADRLSPGVLGMGTGAKVLIRRKLYDLEVMFVGPITLEAAFGQIWGTSRGFRPERESETALGENARLRLGTWNARIENGSRGDELVPSGRSLFTTLPSEIDWPTTLTGTPE